MSFFGVSFAFFFGGGVRSEWLGERSEGEEREILIRRLTRESRFGWTNASYLYGQKFLSEHMKRALAVGADWETFAKATGIGG